MKIDETTAELDDVLALGDTALYRLRGELMSEPLAAFLARFDSAVRVSLLDGGPSIPAAFHDGALYARLGPVWVVISGADTARLPFQPSYDFDL